MFTAILKKSQNGGRKTCKGIITESLLNCRLIEYYYKTVNIIVLHVPFGGIRKKTSLLQ